MIYRPHSIHVNSGERGIILIAVLLSLSLLMVLVGSQVYVTSLAESSIESQLIETQGHFALASGLSLAKQLAAIQTHSENRPPLLDEDSFLINGGEATVFLYDRAILASDDSMISQDAFEGVPSGWQSYASTPNVQLAKVVYKHPHRTRSLLALLEPSEDPVAVLALALLD